MKGHTAGNEIVTGHQRCIEVDKEALRLAKAAPLLLEALKEAREMLQLLDDKFMGCEGHHVWDEWRSYVLKDIARIDSAIAAATRET